MAEQTAIQRVMAHFDNSPSQLATAIGGKVKRQHVEHWVKVGRVPAEYCPDIEALTGVACEELRSDVSWSKVRGTTRPMLAGEGA